MRELSHKILQGLAATILASAALSVQATPSTGYFIYDEARREIGEYDQNGNMVQEHIYLNDRPVAVATTSGMNYVTTDQLNTPRAVTNSSQAVIWNWGSDPFGNGQPTGSLIYNLRLPGQYYDQETGHNYNYERDYDPSTGRYVESDPIGLKGGLDTYRYVGDNPIDSMDPTGLFNPITGNGPVYGNWCGGDWTGGYTKEWNQMTPYEQQHAAPPIGPLDLACEQHDKCYAGCRKGMPCNPTGRSQCFLNCDNKLYGAAYSLGFWGYIVGSAVGRGGQRNEPNAKSCPLCGSTAAPAASNGAAPASAGQ